MPSESTKYSSRAKHSDFILLDMLAIEISYLIAFYARFFQVYDPVGNYRQLNLFVLLVYLVIVFVHPFHSGILRRGYFKEFRNVVILNATMLVVLQTILFALKNLEIYSRIVMYSYIVLDIVIMYIFRIFRKIMITRRMKKNGNKVHLILVTFRENALNLKKTVMDSNPNLYQVDRILLLDNDKKNNHPIDGTKVMFRSEMAEFLRTHIVDEVFIGSKAKEIGNIGKLVSWFLSMGIGVHIMTDVLIHDVPNLQVDKIGDRTCISSSITQITHEQMLIKRILDIILSVIGLVFTLILFIIFAPIIKIQSPGPVFFAQERVGLNGRKFKLYKFRTMITDAEEKKKELLGMNEMTGMMFKIKDDPRIIPIGRVMRKLCIDEFPQFFNVLMGDMSIVGTRPPTVDEFEKYRPHHMSRLAMKPGLTGLWQISKDKNIKDFEEVVNLDNKYITNFSLGLDVEIVFKTVLTVLSGKGE